MVKKSLKNSMAIKSYERNKKILNEPVGVFTDDPGGLGFNPGRAHFFWRKKKNFKFFF